MPRFSRGKLGLATWVAVAFVGAFVPALAPVRGQTAVDEVIVYTTLQSYNLDVFLREADGRSWRRLTADQANDYNAVFSPDGAWVVFCSERRGNPDLFALNLDRGGPPRPLTSSHTMEDAPAFSPDGRSLAFVSDRHGNADIFVMPFAPDDPDGDRHAVNLTNLPGGDFNPVFSPDGTRIAFTSERHLPPTEPAYWQTPMELSGGEIYVMGVDGRDVSRLTRSPGWDGAPSWSEDGERIYFYSHRDSRSRIWQMGADGSNQRPVSPAELEGALWATPAPAGRIAFSAHGKLYSIATDGEDPLEEAGTDTGLAAPVFHLPTGRLLAHGEGPIEGRILREDGRPFAASGTAHTVGLVDRALRVEGIYPSFPAFGPTGHDVVSSQTIPGEFGRRAVVVSRLDGSESRTVHNADGQVFSMSWSPDGEWIVWAEGVVFAPEGVKVDLWRIRPDGSDLENLTDSSSNDAFPDIADDGRIVFRSGRDGDKEIYLVNADGSEPRRLTYHPGVDTMPAISPDGSWVVYASDQFDLSGAGVFELVALQLAPTGEPGAAMPAWVSGKTAVTGSPGPDVHPRFSPDGRWIVYASARGGLNDEPPLFDAGPQPYGEIWVQSSFPDAPGFPVRLTHNKWEDSLPDWAGSGQPTE